MPAEGELFKKAVRVPGYEDCNFGMYVYGHSMYPTVENGSLVLCKKVMDKGVILWGELYVVITGDYRMVKRLQRAVKETRIICVSDNEELRRNNDKRYEPMEVERDKIRNLYLVKGIIKKTQS